MKRQVLALLDSEEGYAVSFMEYVNRQNRAPFEVRAFTEEGQLREYLLRGRAEILLIADRDFRGEMTDWSSACVIRLTEENRAGDGMCVFKYQAAPDVLREAMEIYGTAPGEGGTRILKQRVRVTGVFSPVGRCMKTAFSMALGQRLAEKKPTVLLNFEACPGFDEIMHTEYGQTLRDALYYIRADEPRAPERILPMLQKIGSMDYLPPASSPAELCQIPGEDWDKLISLFVRDSPYEAVVIDYGILPLLDPSLLLDSDLIYMPQRTDYVARAKVRSFFGRRISHEEGALTAGERLGERIRRISISESSLPMSGDRWFENLPYSGLGNFAEECIARDGL